MRGIFQKIYAVMLILAAVVGAVLAFVLALGKGNAAVWCVVGLALSLFLTPTLHECGHILFAKRQKMRVKYAKFACFQMVGREGKLRFSFASPLRADETQTVPTVGGNMKKRALSYVSGGLVFGGAATILIALLGGVLQYFGSGVAFLFWGALPVSAYSFFLNLPPFSYPSGKTDGAVYRGIKRGEDEETAMLSAMEIFGQLAEGKCFAEIDEEHFRIPVLREDAPMYAIMHDLKYRRKLDEGDFDGAAEEINRLAVSEYLTDGERASVAAEILFMHALNRDLERAEASKAYCEEFLKSGTAASHRILTAYHLAKGENERASEHKKAFEERVQFCLLGEAKFERGLMEKICKGALFL